MRAVVFDFDGVILDTETPEFRAWCEIFEGHGCELTPEEWSVCIGTHSSFDPYAVLCERAAGDVPSREEVERVRRLRHHSLVEATPLLPGVLDWLDTASSRALPVAIASSSPARWVGPHLERLDLRSRFACLACWDGSYPPKPDPGAYLHACDALGVEPRQAIAVEDSPNGIAAAKAAGLFTVAVPNPMTAALDVGAADVVVGSLADLPLDALL